MEAENIFVNMPTSDDPHKKVSLQDALNLLICEVQDLKARVDELESWASLTNELATATEKMQRSFDVIAKQLHGSAIAAKAILGGIRPKKGNLN